jgi:nicotinamide-nucleotide amidase
MLDIGCQDEASALLQACARRGWRLATAESCTGGLIAAALTAIPGASEIFDRGFITYANEAKQEMLGVAAATLAADGAVSEQTAAAMVRGVLRFSRADLAIAVTGIAGPGGGGPEKPVGLVVFGIARRDGLLQTERALFEGDRAMVRSAAVRRALHLARAAVEDVGGAVT